MQLRPPCTSRLLWCEPFGEGIPASLFRELSFVRTPSQTADANCEGAKLSPILFPLLPHFKLHAGFPYRDVFLHRCRNPFGGPALLATFHNCSVIKGANDKQDMNSNQIRRIERRLLPSYKASRLETHARIVMVEQPFIVPRSRSVSAPLPGASLALEMTGQG
jgi:hypothetical protein